MGDWWFSRSGEGVLDFDLFLHSPLSELDVGVPAKNATSSLVYNQCLIAWLYSVHYVLNYNS